MTPPNLGGAERNTLLTTSSSGIKALQIKVLLFLGTATFFFRQLHTHSQLISTILAEEERLCQGGIRSIDSATLCKNNKDVVSSSSSSSGSNNNNEYILWAKHETYFEECRTHFLYNETWGKQIAPFVDKIEVKELVKNLNVSGLDIPTTLAILDYETLDNFTEEQMQTFPQPYIIKPSHMSGGVARVEQNEYKCFKDCNVTNSPIPLDNGQQQAAGGISDALSAMKAQASIDLEKDFSELGKGELQYRQLPRRIIIEEDVMVGEIQNDVWMWFSANGIPLFVNFQCEEAKNGSLGSRGKRLTVSTRYKLLPMYITSAMCETLPPKPHNWDEQVRIATQVASIVPGIVRLDFYAGGNKVYFSEFTFTTRACKNNIGLHPRAGDGLLYAVEHNQIDPSSTNIMADIVERIFYDQSWVLVTLTSDFHLTREASKLYPSPVDLCEEFHKWRAPVFYHKTWQNNSYIKSCLNAAREASVEPLRCLIYSGDYEGNLKPVGVKEHPSFYSVMERVNWGRAMILLAIVIAMTCTDTCVKPQRNQFLNNALYLVTVAGVIYFTTNAQGLRSGNTLATVAHESYRAFVYVHPMESNQIVISHFATYWFMIASWNSKSMRDVLFWQFLFELVTASVNEYTHQNEQQNDIRCMRIAFVSAVKNYAVDNIVHEYILEPFLVYGYMLPKFICHWFLHFYRSIFLV